MNSSGLIRTFACAALALGSSALLGEDAPKPEQPAAQKTEQPAPAKPDAKPAEAPVASDKVTISDDAQKLIDQMVEAYGKLKSLELAGTLTGDFEAAGQKQGDTVNFKSSFESPNKFRHSAKDDILVGLTGEKAYAYEKSRNVFAQGDAPKEKVATRDLPSPLPRVVVEQNPSLRLALAKDPAHELSDQVTEIAKVDDAKVGDASCPTLKLTLKDKTQVTMSVDPGTHLIRKTTADLRAQLEAQHVPDIKKALYIVDYTTITPDAPVKAEQFAWAPPQGAKDIKDVKATPSADENPADALVGKDAPAFKLTGLDGKDVALGDLKGSVVVLDFWATWCPPCRASLPHLDKFYQAQKGAGVKVYAVNLQEEKDKVQAFIDKTKLGVPVLLDSEGKTAGDYKASAIPETVVVGKDGKVLKVFVGFNEDTMPDELHKVVQDALKK